MKSRLFLLQFASSVILAMTGFAGAQAQTRPVTVSTTAPGASQPAVPGQRIYDLASFGPLQSVEQANATLQKALITIQAAGGGVLVVPSSAPQGWTPENTTQEALRSPAPPAPAKSWKTGAGVTILDARTGRLALPQMSGLEMERTFSLPPGDSAPHWSYHPMLGVQNVYVSGTSNYQGLLQEAVAAGKARRFAVENLNGLYPGQVLEVPKETGATVPLGEFRETTTVALLTIDSLGYDTAKKQPYFTADSPVALPAGTVLRARTVAGAIHATTNAHTESQTFDVFNVRHHYSQGDSYLFDGRVHYMGDEYAPEGASPYGIPGARNSVVYNAVVKSQTNVFHGTVDRFDAARQELRYTAARNAQTLATGRALINLNPKKWVTQGSAYILNPGGALLNWGNSLRSKDAPWSADMVGRFFAIDEPSEIIPRSDNLRRWWYITGFSVDKNGTKTLNVRRYWWGTKNSGVGISALRDAANYSSNDAKPKLLKYIIAPGAEVYDIADGVALDESESGGSRMHLLKLAPQPWNGTPLDFEKGDPVEQAIGPEPFHPIPFRAWTFDEIPSSFPAPIFDVANNGSIQRNTVLSTGGAWFGDVFGIEASTEDLLVVNGDVSGSLIRFEQHNAARPLLRTFSWNSAAAPQRDLAVDTRSGALNFNGPINLRGNGLSGLSNLGQTADGANFRGVGVAVPAGATSFDVRFPIAQPGAGYAVTAQPGWLTDHAVTSQTAAGFHVTFSTPAPTNARLNWLLID